MNISMNSSVQGFYKIEAFCADESGSEIDGSRRVVADWFPNLILDQGLERMGSSPSYMGFCQVGSGSTPPAVTDSSLVSLVASTSNSASNVVGAQSSAPYFGWRRRVYRFAEGSASGNLSEVGVGWAASGGLFSRALVLDAFGTPTTISVASNESLDVTYELRTYIPTADATGSVVISGVTYNWTSRAAAATNQNFWAVTENGSYINQTTCTAYTGTIGSITGQPSGTPSTITISRGVYSSGSKKIAMTASATLAQGNISGIRSILAQGSSGSIGSYQIQFDPALPKDATKVFSLTYEISWSRV